MVSYRFLSRISQQNQSIDCSATLRVFCVSSFKARVAFLTRFHGTSGTSSCHNFIHITMKTHLFDPCPKCSIECIDEVEARGTISHSQRRSFLHAKFIQVHFHSQLEKLFMFPKFNYHFFCCWFGTCFYFSHHIVNFMIPADELNWCTA